MRWILAALLWLIGTASADAALPAAIDAQYAIYSTGLHVADAEVRLELTGTGYQLRLLFHTAGLVGVFVHSRSDALAQGTWQGGPFHFASSGLLAGEARRTVMDYRDRSPLIAVMQPPNAAEREPVPPAMERGTMDTLSAIAMLIHDVALRGACDGAERLFDGRRLMAVSARTAGEEALAATDRSSFRGRALRCDFSGRELAGFKFSESTQDRQRPRDGTAWLAPVLPGGPAFPVRMIFDTDWVGHATMYLTKAVPAPK